MTILRDISVLFSLTIKMFMVYILIEHRYPKNKSLLLACAMFAPVIVINIFLFITLEPQRYTMFLFFFLTLPSIVIFWILSKHRDSRFIFTLCMVDTLAIEIGHITNIIDFYIPGDTCFFMFFSRIAIFPLLLIWIYKWSKPRYINLQMQTKMYWGVFAIIGLLFYVVITLAMSYPTQIFERPEYVPMLIIIFLLIPIVYFYIIRTLYLQKHLFEISEQENFWNLQIKNMVTRLNEFEEANEAFRKERHDFHHKLKFIASLVDSEQYDELALVVQDYKDTLDRTKVTRYCKSAIIDASLSVYIQKAERTEISVKYGFAFPDTFKVNESELATAIANAIENAINACKKLPKEERKIEIKVLCKPQFIVMVRNTFDGNVVFDEKGIPQPQKEGHGFGTRTIATLCEKVGGYYVFQAEDNVFTLYMHLK
ncbi:MAG: GHKL domain-containing protein [Acutalibacteraceae bacterium]|nr:GHKL domain-containing protein [Acutalibacteraceae bacterium]